MSPLADIVLLATDGSGESDRAARTAVELSRNLGSELRVIQVAPLPSPYASPESLVIDPRYRDMVRSRTKEEVDANLAEEVGRLREIGGEVAGAHAAVGRPDAEIVRHAEELAAGLIVLGSRGLSPLRRAVMGSVSTSVVRHASGSVLVVRGDPGEDGYLSGRVLLATDGSQEAEAASQVAPEISATAGSELHVLFALQTKERPPYNHLMMGEVD